MSIELRTAEVSKGFKTAADKRVRRDFLDVVTGIYRDDPNYVRPLDLELNDRLSPKNPFFLHAEGAIFVAYRGGEPVGRCTAQIDHEHLARHHDATGFFGFLDTIDDPAVVAALLKGAEDWLRQRGMERARGPLSLSINEEAGCLVDGFTTPPMLMMPHHLAYQGGLIEQAGYAKKKDVFAWKYTPGEVPRRARQAADAIKALPEVTYRPIDVKNIERDVKIGMEIFNDAWADNWGFVPMTEPELKKMASDFKLVLIPELTQIVSIDGKPAGICVCLPNLNEFIRDFDGKLRPVNIARLLWRFKVLGPSQARVILLGIRREYRHVRKYAGLSAFMYASVNQEGRKIGIRSAELSWTLEDNGPVNAGIKMMGGKVYKTYRIYERELGDGRGQA
ncbi:MAG: hypothetical protein EOO74_10245 [Myxococcales bacterium]|nr:MAG: hypothetical protein EOO74_10245 [Myxococcales bacterium]